MAQRILIADDDRQLCNLLAEFLGQRGFEVRSVHSAEAALEAFSTPNPPPDLLILDVMLPGMDGLAALRELRQEQSLPVLMLSARGEPMDRIHGLELGADDYLAKPCLPRELLARVNALLRRAPARGENLKLGALHLDLARRSARFGTQTLRLTGAEFALLACLVKHAGKPVGKEQLSLAGLGRSTGRSDRSVDVHLSRLRQKLADTSANAPSIEAVRGVGYVMIEPT